MLLEPTLFGLGCSVSILCAIVTSDDDRIGAALLLTIGWAASNCAWAADGVEALPLLDLATACWFLSAWRVTRASWLRILWVLSGGQLTLHVVYSYLGPAFYAPYAWALNLTFAGQLLAVSKPGAKDAISLLYRRLQHIAGMAHHRSGAEA